MTRFLSPIVITGCLLTFACGDTDDVADTYVNDANVTSDGGGGDAVSARDASSSDAASSDAASSDAASSDAASSDAASSDASSSDAASSDGGDIGDAHEGVDAGTPMRLGAAAWIRREFADDPTMSGDFTRRTTVEVPHLVDGASGCCSKYAFFVRNDEGPDDLRVGFVDVQIRDLMSTDAFGAGIGTSNTFPGVVMYLADVEIEPQWPNWEGYETTNYDGIVLDGSEAVYAEGLTIRAYNADTAIDIKSDVAQFVDLRVEGPGHRTLRYWASGPHYLVDSQINNTGELGSGRLLWFRNCDSVSLRVYNSTFNGESEVPAGMHACEDGTSPDITYLETDPRTTGEMHEMFSY